MMIFIDMFRANILNMFNDNAPYTNIDNLFEQWGGTIYTNCYTPAPDTPRSNGCLWSGQYPKKNGCNTRIKYPKFYMTDPESSLLHELLKNNYKFNFYIHEATRQIGELPLGIDSVGNYSNGKLLEEYLSGLEIEENSLTYISLEDYHAVMYDYTATPKAVQIGNDKIERSLKLIDQKLDIDTFDYIIIFSDHGFKFEKDKVNMSIEQQLDKDRTQIFMYLRKKGDNKLLKNNKLSAIIDIYPTVCDFINIKTSDEIDGISLLSSKEHDYIMLEDHREFNITLSQTIEYWGIVDRQGLSVMGTDGVWKSCYPAGSEVLDNYKQKMLKDLSFLKENLKAQEILDYYDNCLTKCPYYFDGELRVKHYDKRHKAKMAVVNTFLKLMKVR